MNEKQEPHPHRQDVFTPISFAVLTVSSSRGLSEDSSGDLIGHLAENEGHHVLERQVAPDVADQIRAAIHGMLMRKPDILVITGGTGVTPTDVTIEAVQPLLEKELTAFSVLFAQLSFTQIGPAAILSRACAGTIGRTAVFSIPGNPKACILAMERIILPEASHLMAHVQGKI